LFSTAVITWSAGVAFGLLFGGSTAQAVAAEAATTFTAPADRIEIDAAVCAEQVGLIATDAMLSDVLQALAVHLQFELHFKSDRNRAVSVNLQKPGRELIETLGQDDNIMISSEPDARCDEPVDRLVTVWFLGTGPEITYKPAKARRVDQLPETGEEQVRRTQLSDADDKEKTRKRRKDMTPEELYLDKIERKNRKRQDIE